MKKALSLLKKENGQALVIVAILFSVLLGFGALAVEYSYLSLQQRKLQNAADAGALAGIVELANGKYSEAVITAQQFVELNLDHLDMKKLQVDVYDVNDDNKELKVDVKYDFDTLFIKLKAPPSASATSSWTAITETGNSGDGALNNKIIPLTLLEKENSKFSDNDLAFIGYYHKIGSINQEEFYGNFGYFTYKNNQVSKLKEFNEKDLEESFAGVSKKPLLGHLVFGKDYLASLDNRYDDESKEGIKSRIKDSNKPGANKEEIMTAIIPIVRIREEEIGNTIRQIRRDDDGERENDGEHFEFDIVGYRKILVVDYVVQLNTNIFIWENWGRIQGLNSTYTFSEFDDEYIKSPWQSSGDKKKIYEDSIIVKFGEFLEIEDLNNEDTETIIEYRLIK